MATKKKQQDVGQVLFVGIDLHRKNWHVTVRTTEVELFHGTIPGRWDALQALLSRYRRAVLHVVYEAGYFGYWLHDRLVAVGATCIVTPPSLIPQEAGNRVKTDRKDSRKLALLLAKGLLKQVWVPDEEGRMHRQVIRRRRQLIGDRVRTQNRIKAELRFYGIELPEPTGPWTRIYLQNLQRLRFSTAWLQDSFQRLLEEYEFLTGQIVKQTKLLRSLAETDRYRSQVQWLRTIPGIGLIAAMELLLELGDLHRFRHGDQLAAYVGLTPSQHSSADKVRMGRITRSGKNALRGTLIEAAWRFLTKDPGMRSIYDRLKLRTGAKRAVVAVARRLLLHARRVVILRQPYPA
ncbi:IS110 family transposase [Nitrospira sp. Nam74]